MSYSSSHAAQAQSQAGAVLLTKIDEMLDWEGLKPRWTPASLNWVDTCVKCERVSNGGWRN
jgi:hypothetical protein